VLIGNALGMSPVVRTYKNYDGFPLPYCLTGIEVEVEGVEKFDETILKFWNKERDDSLRGKHPAEFVLHEPLFGADLFNAVEQICLQAEKHKWVANYRTSIHVHIDARDISFEAFRAICCLYAIVEPVMFDWIGDKRNESVFCLPWGDAEGDMKKIRKLFYSQGSKELIRQSDHINRYSALNLKALQKQGSIEFRHMRTNFNLPRIVDWIAMCQHIKRYATVIEQQNRLDYHLLELYSVLGVEKFLSEVFGERLAEELLKTYTGASLQPGVLFAQDLLTTEIQKKMGAIFCPPNCFLTQGKSPYFAKWVKLNKPKKGSKKDLTEGAMEAALNELATRTMDGMTFTTAAGRLRRNERAVFAGIDLEAATAGLAQIEPPAYQPPPMYHQGYIPPGYSYHGWMPDHHVEGRWWADGHDGAGNRYYSECSYFPENHQTKGEVHGALQYLWERKLEFGELHRDILVRIYSMHDDDIFESPWRTE
jgi:hypothetical protein